MDQDIESDNSHASVASFDTQKLDEETIEVDPVFTDDNDNDNDNNRGTQTDADGDDNTLVSIAQACESFASSPAHDLSLGVVTISPTRATLTSLRLHVCHHLPTLPPKFGFITPDGGPISKQQEATISVAQVLCDKKVVRICRKFDKPRVGVRTVEGTAIGFVFADHITTVSRLRNIIADQLGTITSADSGIGYQFVDCNNWPITETQESSVGLTDILVHSEVRICPQIFRGGQKCLQSVEDHTDGLNLTGDVKRRKLQVKQLSFRSSKDQFRQMSMDLHDSYDSKQILISYVRQEASQLALDLKQALSKLNYSVYLDVHEIKSGIDWQDALNFAVTNCEVFIPLVTQRYGETLWTNREVKLADVMNKLIVPVNFLTTPWPPKCLAIQFATTQFTPWRNPNQSSAIPNSEMSGTSKWPKEDLDWAAFQISERVRGQAEEQRMGSAASLGRRVSILRNYPSIIPEKLSQASRVSEEDREGPPLIVISVHPKQTKMAERLTAYFKKEKFDVWCSTELEPSTYDVNIPFSEDESTPFSQMSQDSQELLDSDALAKDSRIQFQEHADEACVVVFLLSEAFAASRTCQQQVYYCEHRKRVIPLRFEEFAMPSWMSMLIGTGERFEDARSDNFENRLLARVRKYTDPATRDTWSTSTDNEAAVAKTANQLKHKLGNGVFVYVAGGTKFYSKDSEAICRGIGKYLAHLDDIQVVTGGFYGVGETIGQSYHNERVRMNVPSTLCHILPYRDPLDCTSQGRQNKDNTFIMVPYGETKFAGDSVRERELIVSRIFDICILIEGGPGAAHEAEQFIWNDHVVIPVRRTGGAAGGKFNVPEKIFQVPGGVKEGDWALLSDKKCSTDSTAQAVARIVSCVREKLRLDSPSRGPSDNPFNSRESRTSVSVMNGSVNNGTSVNSSHTGGPVGNTGPNTNRDAFTALRTCSSPRRRRLDSVQRNNTFILEHEDE